MKRKDPIIEYWLNSYLKDEPPKEELLAPAAFVLKSERQARMSARLQATKKRRRFGLTATALSCASLIIILTLSVVFNGILIKGGTPGGNETNNYYFRADVSGTSIAKEDVTDFVPGGENPFPALSPAPGDLNLSVRYTAYRFKSDGSPAYLLLEVRRQSRYGVDEAQIIAEFAEKTLYDYRGYGDFDDYGTDGRVTASLYDEDGEYISKAYFALGTAAEPGIKFYIDSSCSFDYSLDYYLTQIMDYHK